MPLILYTILKYKNMDLLVLIVLWYSAIVNLLLGLTWSKIGWVNIIPKFTLVVIGMLSWLILLKHYNLL